LRAAAATPEQFRELCQRWRRAEPANFQPYNALGRYLESKGLPNEALAAYRKSIEIEWNQPFVTQAIGRREERRREANR